MNPFETNPVYAFPATVDVANGRNGMTLRDHFAGLAMQALLARTWPPDMATASMAYHLADFMLQVRGGAK